ncbi:MAG: hypothetical protein HZB24_11365 [Desulfobacterales bacterium]|nr:hypothetical protein [Desulfobacterales bacterium]
MKSMLFAFTWCVVGMIVLGAVPVSAENTGYAYVFAYSHRLKAAYFSSIITHPAEGQSLSEKEYHADIKMIRQMEDALEKHLRTNLQLNSALFSFSARTGYKTEAYALRQLEADKADLRRQGLEIKLLPDFSFNP